MKKIANFIVKYRHVFTILFLGLVVLSVFMMPKVKVNYDLTKYLQQDSPTVLALKKMEEEFGKQGMAQVMVNNISVDEADKVKIKIESVKGIGIVVFDGASADYYKEGSALFRILLESDSFGTEVKETIQGIRDILVNYDIALNGASVGSASMTGAVSHDMGLILGIACAIVFAVLLLTSTSWADPLMFAIVVAGAVAINMGSNVLLSEISFITQSICAVMQLALAMDYSIMLLHRFNEEKENGLEDKAAVSSALAQTFSPISSSSLTTIAGLVALMFMKFAIGFDIGLVLAKGIVVSLISVCLFMPGILLLFAPLLKKTRHKSIQVLFKQVREKRRIKKEGQGKKIHTLAGFHQKTKVVIPIVVALFILTGFAVQTNLEYGYAVQLSRDPNSQLNVENKAIMDKFGQQNSVVALVPKGDREKEKALLAFLNEYEFKGKKVLQNGQGLVSTGAFDKLNKTQIIEQFGISGDIVNFVFEEMGLKDTDSVVLYDMLKHIATEKTAAMMGENTQAQFESQYGTAYKEIKNAYAPLTEKETMSKFKFANAEKTKAAFIAIKGVEPNEDSKVLTFEFANYVLQHKKEFTLSFPDILSLTITSEAHKQAEVMYTKEQLMEQFKMSDEMVTLVLDFAGVPAGQSVKAKDLMEIVFEDKAATKLGQNMQKEIDGLWAYAQMGVNQFESENFSRLILNLDMDATSKDALDVITELREILKGFYDESYILSETSNALDIKSAFDGDAAFISFISFIAIFVIVLLTFKSLSIPLVLTALIQGAIWITMASNVIASTPIFFLCFLIVSCVQMGATVDYGILLTSRYLSYRKTLDKEESMKRAFDTSILTILTSGVILVVTSFIVGIVSSIPMISELGFLLSRGCLLSVLLVVFALPQTLLLCDNIIKKTTL